MTVAFANILAVAAVLASFGIAAISRWRAHQEEFFGGDQQSSVSVWLWALLLFGVMVLGILARYYWDLLGRGKTFADTDVVGLIRPLFVSPLVFFPLWSQTNRATKTLATVLVAFQNGFFWQAVFERSTA